MKFLTVSFLFIILFVITTCSPAYDVSTYSGLMEDNITTTASPLDRFRNFCIEQFCRVSANKPMYCTRTYRRGTQSKKFPIKLCKTCRALFCRSSHATTFFGRARG